MIDELTLDKILDLPFEVLKKADKYNEYSQLLEKDFYEKYDVIQIKDEITSKFNRFKTAKFTCNLSAANSNIKVTPNYQYREGTSSNKISDPVGDLVRDFVDNQIWFVKFYDCVCNLASKLTIEEAEYFVDTFFSNRTEDFISEKLAISKGTLQKIKKSCLMKTWIEFQALEQR